MSIAGLTQADNLCPDEEIPLGSRYMWVPHVSDQMPFTKKPLVGKEELKYCSASQLRDANSHCVFLEVPVVESNRFSATR